MPVPSTVGTVLITVAAVLGAAVWTWGHIGKRAADDPRVRIGVTLGWLIALAGLAGSLVMFATLNYAAPVNAYASSMELFVFFHAWHLIIALVIGALVLGRLYRGRLAGREYTIECVGYWLWYTAVLAVVMMVLTLALS